MPRKPRPSEIQERTRSEHRRAIQRAMIAVHDAEQTLSILASTAVDTGVLSRAEVQEITGWSQATYYRRRSTAPRLPGL